MTLFMIENYFQNPLVKNYLIIHLIKHILINFQIKA